MRTPVLLLASIAALSLTACAGAPVLKSAPETLPEQPSAPSPVADHDWFYSVDDSVARLAYGLEASDDLRIGLDCVRASGKLELSAMGSAKTAPEIHLESGGEAERYRAHAEPSELHDGMFLTADARTTDPVFQNFRRLGWLALWRDGTREAYAPHPGTRPDIERFFGFCG